ncbi:MAG: 23S rRNA (adenine(2503)-C(2))-methyltransferase RlmN [Deltaproteobacteria bacterium]|nr:23S rRNA (adenine(2503)-C(2))-methyltransferase RlmN [Deltaproteobacteria bacterium]
MHHSQKTDLRNLTRDELTAFVVARGLPSFRAKQIFPWLYRPGITDFSEMTDLSKDLRNTLTEEAFFSRLLPAAKETSSDGTVKYGFLLEDGKVIETVLIPEDGRHTLCVSSQVGCAMDCSFCLTGTMGFSRNLSCAEMVNQVFTVADDLHKNEQGAINNLVFMGMGEPLANFNNLVKALTILTDELGFDFPDRKITVSTCGLVPQILELGQLFKVNLAISLHAADNETRTRLMPINARYPLESLLEACRQYALSRRKRIMFEYILLQGINDSDQDALRLAKLLHGIPAKINLLPCNETPELPYKKPDQKRIDSFQEILKRKGYTVLVRSSRGADISAACGQLAAKSST